MFKSWLISFKGSGSRAHGSAALDHVMIHRIKPRPKEKRDSPQSAEEAKWGDFKLERSWASVRSRATGAILT
jgi:hypothetical protein